MERNENEDEFREEKNLIVNDLIESLHAYTEACKNDSDSIAKSKRKEFARDSQYSLAGWLFNILADYQIAINGVAKFIEELHTALEEEKEEETDEDFSRTKPD
jgi:hypothetical protein